MNNLFSRSLAIVLGKLYGTEEEGIGHLIGERGGILLRTLTVRTSVTTLSKSVLDYYNIKSPI